MTKTELIVKILRIDPLIDTKLLFRLKKGNLEALLGEQGVSTENAKLMARKNQREANIKHSKKLLVRKQEIKKRKNKPCLAELKNYDQRFLPSEKNLHNYDFKEILVLREMLVTAGIPFKWDETFHGYQIMLVIAVPTKFKRKDGTTVYKRRTVDVIENLISVGHINDKLEIQNGITREERNRLSANDIYYGTLGNLTAKEVFKRFKYCYLNNTVVFKKYGRV